MFASLLFAVVGCTAAQAAVGAPAACAVSPGGGGVALAATTERAQALAAAAAPGEARFRAAFDRAPSAYAVWEFDDPAAIAPTRAALTKAGFDAVLALPSPTLRPSPRPGAQVVHQPAGAPDEPREETNLVPHELGHQWYARAFWRDAPRSPGDRYGSPAPDWLDEAAAILMEDEARAAQHRARFAEGRREDPERSAPPEIPLRQFLSMSHPAVALLPPGGGAGGPMRISGPPTLFYAQARVFTDYLLDRSGETTLLATLSDGLRRDGSFEAWLAHEGARHRLPTTLEALDADWRGWLVQRYGAMSPARA